MKFIITIDTEADNQWDHGTDLTTRNIGYVERFQALCNAHDVKPTYFVTSEICEDRVARRIFPLYQESGKAEVGAHLHAWTTAPFLDKEGFRFNDPNHAFATELPEELIFEKLSTLSGQIESSFGSQPVSFRSGRYGFDEVVARALIRLGYKVDSSVTPFTSWKRASGIPGGKGGPDFMSYDNSTYTISNEFGSLLEIPVTILPTQWPFNGNYGLARYFFSHVEESILLKAVRKLMFANQPLWLRPNRYTKPEFFKQIVNEAKKIQMPYLVMMFHSSELMPGGSPYWKDEHEVDLLYRILNDFFSYLNVQGIESIMMKQAAQ